MPPKLKPGHLQVSCKCNCCNHIHIFTMPEHQYWNWFYGEQLIQDTMPELSKGQRDLLLIGTCETCMDKKMAEA